MVVELSEGARRITVDTALGARRSTVSTVVVTVPYDLSPNGGQSVRMSRMSIIGYEALFLVCAVEVSV